MKRKLGTCIVSLLMTAAMVWHAPLMALAGPYYINDGDITITAGAGGQTVTQGSSQPVNDYAPVITQRDPLTSITFTITVRADANQTANVTLQDVNIDTSTQRTAAVTTLGAGSVNIELNGTNTLRSGDDHAGLEKQNDGHLTIMDANQNGSLEVHGGGGGAGIGGGSGRRATNITINGGTVTAAGGDCGAGIGGGIDGAASYITISGGTVTATGGDHGAGIGGGLGRRATNITINGGTVTAAGGLSGAGIGGGDNGQASNIKISGDAQVKASGGAEDLYNYCGSGAAIGSGGTYVDPDPVNGTVVLDTNGLTTGSVSLYEPGKTINEMESGTVQPLQLINGTPVTPGPTPVTPVTPVAQGTTPVIPVIPVMPAFSGTGSGGSATPTASVKPVPQTKQNFDSVYYADNNPDLYEAYGYDHDLLWNHYVTVGRQEGRKVRFVEGIHKGAVDEGKGKEDFDAIAYADYYADLFAVYGYDEDALWNHYDTVGRAEGRLYFSRSA